MQKDHRLQEYVDLVHACFENQPLHILFDGKKEKEKQKALQLVIFALKSVRWTNSRDQFKWAKNKHVKVCTCIPLKNPLMLVPGTEQAETYDQESSSEWTMLRLYHVHLDGPVHC